MKHKRQIKRQLTDRYQLMSGYHEPVKEVQPKMDEYMIFLEFLDQSFKRVSGPVLIASLAALAKVRFLSPTAARTFILEEEPGYLRGLLWDNLASRVTLAEWAAFTVNLRSEWTKSRIAALLDVCDMTFGAFTHNTMDFVASVYGVDVEYD